ncbi:uncharacterized protein CTRU02_212314 [Colletotrichum truncatum]|uniref:Uncharacterized protein n=1 Tax=Colletotrichum truncatum TaxID=5467 RepID=A0ACC3YNR5_COLTU|nr:uncharacterized protein CTRU02_08805 [Colletotrichum truncatum]KAF6789558.1 hypothetical protein CTRU02_08805 [Colletotrichum truncatum]
MSNRVPDIIALPTGEHKSTQQQSLHSNLVPDQIALPSGEPKAKQPELPQQPELEEYIDPRLLQVQPQLPQHHSPNGYLPETPQDLPPTPSSDGFYGYQSSLPQQPPQMPLRSDPSGNFNIGLLAEANENYLLAGQSTFNPSPPQDHAPQEQHIQHQAEPEDPEHYFKSCNFCRKGRHHCSGERPCNVCVTVNVRCEYELLPGAGAKVSRNRKRNLDVAAGSQPVAPNDPSAKRRKTGQFQQQPEIQRPPLHRIKSPHNLTENGSCDHCSAGGNEGKDCDANHAEQIECSQCTKYRNLADPNHICKVRGGGEYWQKRFANSRPLYPNTDSEASCCAGCKKKRTAHKPQMCDIDIQVKIGCTPCRRQGRLCEAYNERRANGTLQGESTAAEQMWNRPDPSDGDLAPGRRPWWRHLCEACIPELDNKRWTPCSWINDFRLGEYKCLTCTEKGRRCVDPWTKREFTEPYVYPGHGDHLVIDGKSVNRIGNRKCGNCRVNHHSCRGFDGPTGFACSKCTAWGLRCMVQREPGKPAVELPHPDRKLIGWTRNTGDTGHLFVACVTCRMKGRNCDRKRPCDSCVKFGSQCDAFLGGGGRCRRDENLTGADSPDYYMALGYGPGGVDTSRWDVPENELIGPNRPKWVVTNVQPTQQQQEQHHRSEAQNVLPREYGGVEAAPDGLRRNPPRSKRAPRSLQPARSTKRGGGASSASQQQQLLPGTSSTQTPTPTSEGVGEKYDAFWNSFSPIKGSYWDDATRVNTPVGSSPRYFGDNLAAAEATQNGKDWESWVTDFNDFNDFNAAPQSMAPFEGRPQNLDEIQRIVGEDVVMSDVDAERLANEIIDPILREMAADIRNAEAEEDKEQKSILGQVRDAMTAFCRDARFVPVELRHYPIPDLFEVPEQARVPGPERILLQLTDQPGAAPRQPFARSANPTAQEQHLQGLLVKWKKPGFNVLNSIPDQPLAEGNLWNPEGNDNRTCEEWQTSPANGQRCNRPVPNGAACENLEHMVRPTAYMVCDGCDGKSKTSLFEGAQPLTHGEFMRMRAYACDACSGREKAAADFGAPGKPAHALTGCMCGLKILGRRLCMHHRWGLATQLMVQTMFVAEWAVANYGPDACLFCKGGGTGKTDLGGDFLGSLVYLCLNCQGVVAESFEPALRDGVQRWLGGTVPATLVKQHWGSVLPPPHSPPPADMPS